MATPMSPKPPNKPIPTTGPQEFVEGLQPSVFLQEHLDQVISYLYDIETLRHCSLTCRSWYRAVQPSLHCHLTIDPGSRERKWDKALEELPSYLHPFVTRFGLVPHPNFYPPKSLTPEMLDIFSKLKNLRELRLDNFEIPKVAENARNYTQFPTTLQTLVLVRPVATHQQVLYFIGLFPNLRDFGLVDYDPIENGQWIAAPYYPFVPPLDGWLAFKGGKPGYFIRTLLYLHQKFRFSGVDFATSDPGAGWTIEGVFMPTVETYQFDDTRLLEKPHPLECISPRTLRLSASEDPFKPLAANIKATISQAPSSLDKVVLVYKEQYFSRVPTIPHLRTYDTTSPECCECNRFRRQMERFKIVEEVHKERDFQLVLCAEVSGSVADKAQKTLEDDVSRAKEDPNFGLAPMLASVTIISTKTRIFEV